jgi:hypothetical protein
VQLGAIGHRHPDLFEPETDLGRDRRQHASRHVWKVDASRLEDVEVDVAINRR